MASVDDLQRARREFLQSSLGQHTRKAWTRGREAQPRATDKQRRYLAILSARIENEVRVGRIAWPDYGYVNDEIEETIADPSLSVSKASDLIDLYRRLLGEA